MPCRHIVLDIALSNAAEVARGASRPFLGRVPDPLLVGDDTQQGLDRVVATCDVDGRYAMVYFPTGKPATIALNKLKGETIRAWWFDPRTGAARSAGEFEPRGGMEFTPPSCGAANDWVLVLDDASRGFLPAGTSRSDPG